MKRRSERLRCSGLGALRYCLGSPVVGIENTECFSVERRLLLARDVISDYFQEYCFLVDGCCPCGTARAAVIYSSSRFRVHRDAGVEFEC